MGPFRIFTKICRDIRNFVFITGVVDTGDKPFTGVEDTGNKLSPVPLLQAIYFCQCR
jgi:hypothetical protein